MEKLKLELTQLDQLFSQRWRQLTPQATGSSRAPIATVEGFSFPLKSEQDVERLEKAVNSNPAIKEQYVQLLKVKKQHHTELVDSFRRLFDTTAMTGYTWAGCQMIKLPKKAMKTYSIFNGCMMEIFFIESVQSECEEFTIRTARRPTEVVIEEDDDNTEEEYSPTETIAGFRFPLKSPDMIEQLEAVVRQDPIVRKQYVDLLRKKRKHAPRATFAFLELFNGKALLDYNYSGRCNFSGSKKKAMKDYLIFVDCINEAWGSHESPEELRQYICNAITLINNRKRGARFRSKRRNSSSRKK